MKIIAYATADNGDGYVSKLGEWDSVDEMCEDFEIRCGLFASNVVISFEVTYEKELTDF